VLGSFEQKAPRDPSHDLNSVSVSNAGPAMQAVYHKLGTSLLEHYDALEAKKPGSRLLIAVAGPPGSGKTTSMTQVATIVNAQRPQNSPLTLVVSMDGYHYPRAYLDTLPNREEAYIRRGALWTFNAAAIVTLVRRC